MSRCGSMVISLDFELLWGVVDHETIETYGERVLGARKAIPEMLSLFTRYGIHATWGVVGLIANESMEQSIAEMPEHTPTYYNEKINVYRYFNELKTIPENEKYLFARELLKVISETENQEVAGHTYAHFYCSEQGQNLEQFKDDMRLLQKKLGEFGGVVSLIFPRNQFNKNYTQVLIEAGIRNYRGNEKSWIYSPGTSKKMKSPIRRVFRLVDAYFPITGNNCYDYTDIKDENGLNNVRSSRFFRPYSRLLHRFESLRLRRIKGQMRYAAMHGKVFHLWWHPHNFGKDLKENLKNLNEVLKYFQKLNRVYGFQSMTMAEAGNAVVGERK